MALSPRVRWSRESPQDPPADQTAVTVWVDDDALIENVSADATSWLGFLPAELVGSSVTELVHPEHVPQLELHACSFEEPRTVAARMICRDGRVVPAEIIRYPKDHSRNMSRIDVITWM